MLFLKARIFIAMLLEMVITQFELGFIVLFSHVETKTNI